MCSGAGVGTGLGRQKPDYPHFPIIKSQVYPEPPSFPKMENLFIFKFAYQFKDFSRHLKQSLSFFLLFQKDDINSRSCPSSKSEQGSCLKKVLFLHVFVLCADRTALDDSSRASGFDLSAIY